MYSKTYKELNLNVSPPDKYYTTIQLLSLNRLVYAFKFGHFIIYCHIYSRILVIYHVMVDFTDHDLGVQLLFILVVLFKILTFKMLHRYHKYE